MGKKRDWKVKEEEKDRKGIKAHRRVEGDEEKDEKAKGRKTKGREKWRDERKVC